MFEEVYQNAKEVNPKINDGIKLYIMDAMYINAYAIGQQTVAVTREAIESLAPDQLKGVLAHELGHITHGHTKALLLSVIGNFYFSIIVWIFRLLFSIAQTISNTVAKSNVTVLAFSFITYGLRLGLACHSFELAFRLSACMGFCGERKLRTTLFSFSLGHSGNWERLQRK